MITVAAAGAVIVVAGVAATIREVAGDGYRQVPTRRHRTLFELP